MQRGATSVSAVGELLREWRGTRGVSQLELALDAGVSARHLSFIETGRAEPSRELVIRLCDALDVPLLERNALLQASGYAPLYRELPLDAEEMAPVRDAIEHILRGHGTNPAFLLNERYDLLQANDAAAALFAALLPPERVASAPRNTLELMLGPDYLRPLIENWEEVARMIMLRVQREAWSAVRKRELRQKLRELAGTWPAVSLPDLARRPEVVIPVRFRTERFALNLFSTITTIGTPIDATLQQLRIEALFPADAESAQILRNLSARS